MEDYSCQKELQYVDSLKVTIVYLYVNILKAYSFPWDPGPKTGSVCAVCVLL